jgi:uncharacterized peroxidase-related enzyme
MHGAVASAALGDGALVQAVLSDWRTAPVREQLRAMLGFLEQLTLSPETITAEHMAPLRAAGLSDAAIEDAIHVCALFNMFDRLADALGFEVPPPHERARIGEVLLRAGYRAPPG